MGGAGLERRSGKILPKNFLNTDGKFLRILKGGDGGAETLLHTK